MTPRRLSRIQSSKLSIAEALTWLCRAEPTSKDTIDALHSWAEKTPARAALLQVRQALLVCTATSLKLGACWPRLCNQDFPAECTIVTCVGAKALLFLDNQICPRQTWQSVDCMSGPVHAWLENSTAEELEDACWLCALNTQPLCDAAVAAVVLASATFGCPACPWTLTKLYML